MERSCSTDTGCSTNSGYHWTSDQGSVVAQVSSAEVVADLDLLLTGGRTSEWGKSIVANAYDDALSVPVYCSGRTQQSEALAAAQMMMLATPEFHASNQAGQQPFNRPPPEKVVSQNRDYKAVVVVFLNGGADSYNMLIPHSNCPAKDMYAEYALVRDVAKLSLDVLDSSLINVPPGTQPCATFAVHPALSLYKRLYADEDAAFIANIGTLIEPLTKDEFTAKTKRIPPSLFAHNTQQRQTQSVHSQMMAAKGVLGRIRSALNSQQPLPYATNAYSIHGSMKMAEGDQAPNIIGHSGVGVEMFADQPIPSDQSARYYTLNARASTSIFAETFSLAITNMLNETARLGEAMAGAESNLREQFGDDKLEEQLRQVAKLISLRSVLESERDLFVVKHGDYDHHSNLDDALSEKLAIVDRALTTFVDELKGASMWNNVTIVTVSNLFHSIVLTSENLWTEILYSSDCTTRLIVSGSNSWFTGFWWAVVQVSDFGRTLTSNGIGTDHAWGGNHIIMGGAVRGGQIHGQFPDTLTSDGDLIISRGRVIPTTPWYAPNTHHVVSSQACLGHSPPHC
eukprot:COSAG02_NODE_2078_length_9908_cov_6.512489_5_plen_568_part_01